MKLLVKKTNREDIYRDTIRIPERHRRTSSGQPIPEGRICKATVAGITRRVAIRGLEDEPSAVIQADEVTRKALGLSVEMEVEVQARVEGLLGEWLWAWKASDPIARASVQSNLVSVALGVTGFVLGLVSLYLTLRK